ncbi:hypothetical protein MMC26_001401 [Xylographa opegraphella]|nr:hypothetical protein [Xylographa opegraphella]
MACKTLTNETLNAWEYGNEPNLYRGSTRPSDWTIAQYTKEWLAGTKLIDETIASNCPDVAQATVNGYMAPSMSGVKIDSGFTPSDAFKAQINNQKNIKQISVHSYMTGSKRPGVTLQRTLMNHNWTINSVDIQVAYARFFAKAAPNIPLILGETNSLSGGGAPGASNSFGAALWVLDFGLYCASQNITRIHFHQSEGAAYSAWQAMPNKAGPPATLPPYYGKIALATFIGNEEGVQIVHIPRESVYEAAYAAYVHGQLTRIAVINLLEFNSTQGSTAVSSAQTPQTSPDYASMGSSRPSRTFVIHIPGIAGKATVQRLHAAGSDATTNITFNNTSYDYDRNEGLPVQIGQSESLEALNSADDGSITIEVPDSEAAILSFDDSVSCARALTAKVCV